MGVNQEAPIKMNQSKMANQDVTALSLGPVTNRKNIKTDRMTLNIPERLALFCGYSLVSGFD